VALRFLEYALTPPAAAPYQARLLDHPAILHWIGLARADPRRIAHYEVELGAAQRGLSLF